MAQRFVAALPYVLLLVISAGLFYLTGEITYPARPGQIGPDFWPKVAIGLMALVSSLEILRLLIMGPSSSTVGIAESLDRESDADGTGGGPSSLLPLIGGIVLTLAYAAAVPVLGFILASFVYVVLFMYLAGVRNHLAVWLVAVVGVFTFALIFLKLVYVSMPRGMPPFDQVTQAVMDLLLIK